MSHIEVLQKLYSPIYRFRKEKKRNVGTGEGIKTSFFAKKGVGLVADNPTARPPSLFKKKKWIRLVQKTSKTSYILQYNTIWTNE